MGLLHAYTAGGDDRGLLEMVEDMGKAMSTGSLGKTVEGLKGMLRIMEWGLEDRDEPERRLNADIGICMLYSRREWWRRRGREQMVMMTVVRGRGGRWLWLGTRLSCRL